MALRNSMRALGGEELPHTITVGGRTLHLQTTFKHDFLAAVALYDGDGEGVVLKQYRSASFFGIPLGWVGRMMVWHEATVLAAAQDLRGVPALLGRYGRTGILRQYIPGRPLTRDMKVDSRFFEEFFRLLAELHGRGIAYVDLEKPENIILGDDGLPYLIDFQVAFRVPKRFLGDTLPLRWMRRALQSGDLYHARKHLRRLMQDELSDDEIAASRKKPLAVRVGNMLHAPLKKLRRRIMGKQ